MREYEVTIIIQPKLEEGPRNELIKRVEGWLTFGEDEATKPVAHHWGRRHMAYEIQKNREGYYVFYEAKLDPVKISDIERNFQYSEDIIRYLVVRKEQ